MEWVLWVLAGVLAYSVATRELDRRGVVPEWIHLSGPLTTVHTQRGKAILDRLSRHGRFWRAWANVGVGVALVVMFTALVFVVLTVVQTVRNPQPLQVTEPRNVVAIPGLNDFLPLSVAPEIVLGLLVGLVVHEGAHGLLCRVEDIEIDSMGVALLTVIPLGAFVEPDQESQAEADRGGRTRMFAAGVTSNFVVTILAFALLFGPVTGAIAVAAGAGVGQSISGSPADGAGLDTGDRITALDGEPVDDRTHLQDLLANESDADVELTVNDDRDVDVERRLFVTSAVAGSALDAGERVAAVDGEPVATVPALEDALAAGNETVTLTVEDEEGVTDERTVPIGARAAVSPDGAFEDAGADVGDDLVIVSIDGQRVLDDGDYDAAVDDLQPGDEATVVAYDADDGGGEGDAGAGDDAGAGGNAEADGGDGDDGGDGGEREEFAVTVGGSDGDPDLGVVTYAGVTGMVLDDLGVQYYPADRYLALLGGDDDSDVNPAITDSFVGKTFFAIMLPLAGFFDDPTLPFNFAGFTGDVADFYTVEGALAPIGGGVFVLANVLFWIGWINLNLGFFNCFPAFPLDGGHILRTSTEAVVSRLPIENGHYALTKLVTVSIGLTIGFGLVFMIVGPRLLA